MADRHAKTRRAYQLLRERNGYTVTIAELMERTGWARDTARTYATKHWRPWLERVATQTYRVDGFALISEEEFIQRQSQVKSDNYGEAAALRELLDQALQTGEGQQYEFKEAFPEQAHNLGTEIAAFATSGGGTIFLGVSDASAVIGLVGLGDAESRSDFRERVEGIARTTRPAVVLLRPPPLCQDRQRIAASHARRSEGSDPQVRRLRHGRRRARRHALGSPQAAVRQRRPPVTLAT